ncbi:hypothetical protein [Lysobacter gummosus]|uniref:hypothetical protein n=1 Tax=Lysobacter gummosus TaxID=262324 RepID=UPI00363CE195
MIALCSREHTEIQLYGQGPDGPLVVFVIRKTGFFSKQRFSRGTAVGLRSLRCLAESSRKHGLTKMVRPVATLRSSGA